MTLRPAMPQALFSTLIATIAGAVFLVATATAADVPALAALLTGLAGVGLGRVGVGRWQTPQLLDAMPAGSLVLTSRGGILRDAPYFVGGTLFPLYVALNGRSSSETWGLVPIFGASLFITVAVTGWLDLWRLRSYESTEQRRLLTDSTYWSRKHVFAVR